MEPRHTAEGRLSGGSTPEDTSMLHLNPISAVPERLMPEFLRINEATRSSVQPLDLYGAANSERSRF
jgi:hypothetical protein